MRCRPSKSSAYSPRAKRPGFCIGALRWQIQITADVVLVRIRGALGHVRVIVADPHRRPPKRDRHDRAGSHDGRNEQPANQLVPASLLLLRSFPPPFPLVFLFPLLVLVSARWSYRCCRCAGSRTSLRACCSTSSCALLLAPHANTTITYRLTIPGVMAVRMVGLSMSGSTCRVRAADFSQDEGLQNRFSTVPRQATILGPSPPPRQTVNEFRPPAPVRRESRHSDSHARRERWVAGHGGDRGEWDICPGFPGRLGKRP